MDKGNDIEAPAGCIINIAQNGLMVTDKKKLELRLILEEILPHESSGYSIPSGKLLDPAFGPGPALLGLTYAHQARPLKHGKVGRVPVALRGCERVHSRRPGIIPQDVHDGIQENAFPVPARTIDEKQSMLGNIPGKTVSRYLLKKPLQVLILSSCLVEELQPQSERGRSVRRRARLPGQVVILARGPEFSRSQINRAFRCAQ